MTFGVNSGAAQGTSLPPVEDSDVKAPQQDAGLEQQAAQDPKTDKQQAQSQPTEQAQAKDGQQPDAQQAKDKGPGPWDAKLAQLGLTDPKFSEFLRTEVQPYVTQLEQGGQGQVDPQMQENAASWQELQSAFSEDPEAAYRELGELLGIGGVEGEGDLGLEGPEGLEGEEDEGLESDPRLEYVDQIMQRERQQKEDQEYDAFLTAMGERMPGFDPDLFTQFVVANQGNLDAAMSTYEKYHRAPEPSPAAPPATDGGGTAPSANPKYGSIGDAMTSFLEEQRAASPNR